MTVTRGTGKNSETCALSRDEGALRVAQGAQGDGADVARRPELFLFCVALYQIFLYPLIK